MALTIAFLLKCVADAQKALSADHTYITAVKGGGESGEGVVSEINNGRVTGRIIVLCNNGDVLKGFIAEAGKLGYTVENPQSRQSPRNLVFVTPKHP